MKILLYAYCAAFLFVGSCAETKHSVKIDNLKKSIKLADSAQVVKYANTITQQELKDIVYEFASDEFFGREAGEEGQHKAAQYIKTFYVKNQIS